MESSKAVPSPGPVCLERFRELMHQLLEGSPAAARELQDHYAGYIIRAVRRRLPRTLRPKFDSVDFVQDVWASFYRGLEHVFESPDHLIAFLTRLAQNKVVDAKRERLSALRHNASREEPLKIAVEGQEAQRVFARGATPSETAIGREMWQKMLEGERPAYQKVLTLMRDGYTQHEVAAQLGLHVKTVQRILQRAMEKARI